MRCYVINLVRATERRIQIQKEFRNYNVDFEFVQGIDWKEFTKEYVRENCDEKFNSKPIKDYDSLYGALACWLSHRKVWQKALQNDEDVVAVFEDDARLSSELKPALNMIRTIMGRTTSIDIVFLYNGKPKYPLFPVYQIDGFFSLNLIKYDSIGAVGYVINRNAMITLLDRFPLMTMHIDRLMHSYWKHGLNTYMLVPQVVFHGEAEFVHHSFNKEPVLHKHSGRKSQIRTIFREFKKFCDRLFPRYIPRALAFRKRLKVETSKTTYTRE